MGAYRFDYKRWPLVFVFCEGELTHAQVESHLREYRELLNRNKTYAMVYDTTAIGSVDAFLRKRYAEFHSLNAADFRRLCKGIAFVIDSGVVRGALTAILWMTELPFPYKVMSHRAEAEEWARKLLL